MLPDRSLIFLILCCWYTSLFVSAQDSCNPNPCQNRGNCSSTNDTGFVCRCAFGYSGSTCAEQGNEFHNLEERLEKARTDHIEDVTKRPAFWERSNVTGTYGTMGLARCIDPCQCAPWMINYNGTWHNQMGSYMELIINESSGSLHGEYFTVAARTDDGYVPGAPVVGLTAINGNYSTFGFVGSWFQRNVVTWTGEYKICNGDHVLFTTWVMKPPTPSCLDSTLSTRIGQDCFTRFRQIDVDGTGQCVRNVTTNPCNTPC